MKKNEVNLLFLLLPIIALPFLGFFLGGAIGDSIDERKALDEKNKPWAQIDSSYSFVQIVDATSDRIWAETEDGKLYFYSWDFGCDEGYECLKWIETKEVPADLHNKDHGELPLEKGRTCLTTRGVIPPEPPQSTIECALGSYMTIVFGGRYYALLKDGTIWFWETPVGTDSPGTFYNSLFGFIVGIAVSILISITIFISNMIQKKKRKQGIYQ